MSNLFLEQFLTSFLDDISGSSDTKALMSQIIKSKSRFYVAVYGTGALAANLNTNADLVGSAEDQSGPRIPIGIGFHTAIENDKLLTGHNSEVFSSCQHLNAEVPHLVPSVLKKPKDEGLSQENSELILSDPYAPAFAEGGQLSGAGNSGFKPTLNESYSQGNGQAIASVDTSTDPDGPQVMISRHDKKRSSNTRNDHGQEKKAKTDEE